MTARRVLRRWWPRSLRRQLILGVTTVVSAVLIAVGAVSVMILRGYVTSMVDSEVSRSLAATSQSFQHDGTFIGMVQGSVTAVMRGDEVIKAAVFSGDQPETAPVKVAREIESQSWTDGPPRTVTLAGLGTYRMQSHHLATGDMIVAGVSLEQAKAAVTQKTLITGGLIAVALVITGVGTLVVVQYALRPLRRVAATAAAAATLSLDDGERITARVDENDTHPDNEVGVVGATLNRLLANVDSALAERAESDRRMRRFLADASHELRTPLAAIQGYAELTRQDSAVLPPTTEYALARVESEAVRMSSLVNELLLLSRLDEGQDLEPDIVDLVDLAIDAINDVAVAGPSHHWTTDLPDGPVWVRGDRARLHQLVTNLLNNARVHTPDGVTVTTAITHDGSFAELTVMDNGPDIDADLLPHLFERFVRADKARCHESGGTGLGLAIVAAIVEAHGGTVTAESSSGVTIFRVRLPMIAEPLESEVESIGRSLG
jgi:two-component system, OmpR family, sensor histidine kinase TrcS